MFASGFGVGAGLPQIMYLAIGATLVIGIALALRTWMR